MKHIKCAVALFVLLFIVKPCFSQSFPDSYFEAGYGKLKYGFYVPENYDSTKTYPLLTYLHGWSANYSVYLNWYDKDFQAEHPCFVYTPKTPTTWADWSGWWDQLTAPMTAAVHVMDSLISVYSVDTNRLYVYGISMGGEGTFDLLHKFPDKFAAAMSVCGGGQPFWAENIAKTPFWMFHGSADDINPPKLTEQVYEELVKIGAQKMRYKSYPGYGHEIWGLAEREPSWHDWMFSHSRNDTVCTNPSGIIQLEGAITADGKIQLSWNDIRNSDSLADKIWYYKIFNADRVIGTTEYNKTRFTFPATNAVDSFQVSAVNYHFKESALSNSILYKNGSIEVGIRERPVQPRHYRLYDNYPNPFNPTTVIEYSIPENSMVSLKLYDAMGREVATMVDESQPVGAYSVYLHVNNLSSGVFFYRMKAHHFIETKKLIVLK